MELLLIQVCLIMSGGNRNFTTGGLRGKGLGAWITDPVKILMCVAVFTSAGAHGKLLKLFSFLFVEVFQYKFNMLLTCIYLPVSL